MSIDVAKMKRILEERKRELIGDDAELTEASPRPVDPIEANDGPDDMEDKAVDVDESQKEQAIRINDRSLLSQINAALQRIEDGTYGKCVVCGQDIPEKRLEALPWAARCIKDEEALEREMDSRDEAYDQQTLQ